MVGNPFILLNLSIEEVLPCSVHSSAGGRGSPTPFPVHCEATSFGELASRLLTGISAVEFFKRSERVEEQYWLLNGFVTAAFMGGAQCPQLFSGQRKSSICPSGNTLMLYVSASVAWPRSTSTKESSRIVLVVDSKEVEVLHVCSDSKWLFTAGLLSNFFAVDALKLATSLLIISAKTTLS